MANAQDTAKVFNCPNYSGILYTSSPIETPFYTLVRSSQPVKKTISSEFVTGSFYSQEQAKQPEISEDTSLTAPSASTIVRSQETNVTQIFQETVAVSYMKLANNGLMSGVNIAGQENNVNNELNWQVLKALEKIAMDVEHSFINGVYNKATSSTEVNKTRGMLNACGTNVDANNQPLTYEMINEAMEKAWNVGATFEDFYFFVNGAEKREITKIFKELNGFVMPQSRNVGGVNITEFETDFGIVKVALSKRMPKGSILGADLKYISAVEQDTPGKGNFFAESLARVGAGEKVQIFGMTGLDHGPKFKHLKISNLKGATV